MSPGAQYVVSQAVACTGVLQGGGRWGWSLPKHSSLALCPGKRLDLPEEGPRICITNQEDWQLPASPHITSPCLSEFPSFLSIFLPCSLLSPCLHLTREPQALYSPQITRRHIALLRSIIFNTADYQHLRKSVCTQQI